jgi:hypothetical protein
MSGDPAPLPLEEARAILARVGVTLPDEEVERFAEAAAVMRAQAALVPAAASLADEPAVVFEPVKVSRA